ncbi:MAG: prepilin-type N-terminal cleavage/methylation domain-containing protein [Pyrinomonadaceae bacterium]|nr:prepilin-type N-terminal cleavage/methylation domain-containing protein [Phycisphaerales bacterium]
MLGNTHTTVIHSTSFPRTGRRGFSLIEIMIVMIILITLIAIFVPVLAGARNSSRKFATQQLFTGLQTSSSQFELDQRRLPGYFSQVNMGSAENATRGLTQLQNMLLDLSGGTVANGANTIDVGPNATGTVKVDVNLINAPSEAKGVVKNVYYNVDRKSWAPQTDANQKVAINEHKTLPDLLDAWSNPVLAWVEDDSAPVNAPFARMDSGAAPNYTRAKFYWNSNAAFLQATALGRGIKNQVEESLISTGLVDSTKIVASMAGLLGHPAFPVSTVPAPQFPIPASSRSKIVFHSAGVDGVFLGAKDRGGLVATAAGGSPQHQIKVVDYKGSQGDPLDIFDDVITVGGN